MFIRFLIILIVIAGISSCTKNDCEKGQTTIQFGLDSDEPPPKESDCGVPALAAEEIPTPVQTPPVEVIKVVDTPVASPSAGEYILAQTVTLSTTTPDVTIYYTTDGTTPSTSSILYTGPVPIAATATLKVIGLKSGYTSSTVASFDYKINGTAGFPVFNPPAGGYGSAQTVTITSTTPGATIYYTTDGTMPTTSSAIYTSPLSVTSTTTVTAYAVAPIHEDSSVTSATFLINGAVADPTISPSGGTYGPAQTVTLASTTPGASIYYTTNGSSPSGSSTIYTGPFSISSTSTLKVVAIKSGYNDSNITTAAFTINGTVGTPTFSPVAGGYGPTQTVTISSSTPGATIYYTTNGSLPTTSSAVYSAPLTVSSTTTIRAYATKSLFIDSSVASGTFTINGAVATPTFSPNGGSFGPTQSVTLSTTTPSATIYYTINGSTPTTASTLYTGAISVSTSRTLKAIAVKSQFSNSAEASATFTINGAVGTPTFSIVAGDYSSTQNVTISSSTAGATFYYTTNNTTPTTSSTLYTGPVAISAITTLQAIGIRTGFTNSSVRTAVYNVTTYGIMSTVAGTGLIGADGDGGLATSAQLYGPSGIAVDGSGNIYISDTQNNTVRKVTTGTNVISIFAGTGVDDFAGDGGAAASARLRGPSGLAFDGSGNLYIADSSNHRIRKVTMATGIITTIAGDGNIGSSGDGGQATLASLQSPSGLAFDSNGNLYIADEGNHKIRKIDTSGVISTLAGNGTSGYTNDGVNATTTRLYNPSGVAIDSSGNLYIADSRNNRIRKVILSTGIISTFAGTGSPGSSGDGGAATSAALRTPKDVKLDSLGNILISDQFNHKIRMVKVSDGFISTVVGTGTPSYTGDGGYAVNSTLSYPVAIAIGSSNNIFIADFYNNVIRKSLRIP